MATPSYEFVSDSPLTPILQGANTAFGGITLERAASQKQQERLRSMAQVLGKEGFLADAAIYEQMALSESPDYATAALTGKATTRDLALPFNHALKVIESQRNRQTSLDVAGVRSGTGTMSRAAMNARDEQIGRRVAILDRTKRDLDNEVQRYEVKIQAARANGDEVEVEALSEERDRIAKEASDTQTQIEVLLKEGEANVANTFGAPAGGGATSTARAGAPTRSLTQEERNAGATDIPFEEPPLPGGELPIQEDTIPTGKPVAADRRSLLADAFAGKPASYAETNSGTAIANAFAGKEDAPPSRAIATPADRTLLPDIPAGPSSNTTEAGSLLTRPRPAAETARAQNAGIGPDTPIPPKTPEISVTEKPAAAEKTNEELAKENKLDYELPYARTVDPTASRVAKDKFAAGKIFASRKQQLYIKYGYDEQMDKASSPAELKLVESRLAKKKDQYGAYDSSEEAAAAGERNRGTMPDKDLYSTVVKKNPDTGKYYFDMQKKGGGIRSAGPNYYVSESTGESFYVDQSGYVIKVDTNGQQKMLMSKDNPNAGMTKAEFENHLRTGALSEVSDQFPKKVIDPSTAQGQKDSKSGIPAAPKNSILNQFKQSQQNATQRN